MQYGSCDPNICVSAMPVALCSVITTSACIGLVALRLHVHVATHERSFSFTSRRSSIGSTYDC
jgi:hypothetical protein